MGSIKNQDLTLDVPHRAKRPISLDQPTANRLDNVGQQLGLLRIQIVPLRRHFSKRRTKRGAI
jgi:hypothetical protein